MMRFFRQHQKLILLGMAILMVLFLVPAVFELGRAGGRNPVVATYVADGKEVRVRILDVRACINDLDIFRFAGSVRQSVAHDAGRYVQGRLGKEGGTSWYLWNQLAQANGITVTEAERKDFMAAHGVTDEVVAQLEQVMRVTADEVDAAFSRLAAVNKMTDMAEVAALAIPEQDVRIAIRDISEIAHVHLVTPEVDRLKTVPDSPADADLKEMFDRHKDKPRQPGALALGYRVPPKVAVEMLVIDSAELARQPDRLTFTDPLTNQRVTAQQAAFAYYRSHQSEFAETPQTQPQATQPEPAKVKPFAEVCDQIIAKLTTMRAADGGLSPAEALAERMAKEALDLAAGLKAAGKPVLYGAFDPGVKNEDTVAGQLRVKMQFAPRIAQTRLFSRDEAGALPGDQPELLRGQSLGGERYPLLDVAFNCEPLLTPPVRLPPDFEPLKLGEHRDVYRAGTRYFIWRLTQAEKDRSPTDLAEVRDLVVADLITERTMSLAREQLRKVETLVKAGTKLADAVAQVDRQLNEQAARRKATTQPATQPQAGPATQPVATQPDETYLQLDPLQPVKRREITQDQRRLPALYVFLRGQGMSEQEAYREAMMASVDIQVQPPDAAPSLLVVAKAFELAGRARPDSPEPERTAVVDDPAAGIVALVQFVSLTPATDLDYRRYRAEVLEILRHKAQLGFVKLTWLNSADLARRMNFQDLVRREQEE